jgi:hypothetical protein
MPLKARVAEVLFASFLGSLIYYAVLLPFLVLLFANSFWRKRFEAISGIETRTVAEPPPWG